MNGRLSLMGNTFASVRIAVDTRSPSATEFLHRLGSSSGFECRFMGFHFGLKDLLMNMPLTRRTALKATAAFGAGYWLNPAAAAISTSPNEKLNVACIGIGGQGGFQINGVDRAGQNIVGLCDVDDVKAGKQYDRFPKAKKYYDFRRMLSEMDKQIDAVTVSTPDHMHFNPSMMAMNMGKHLYCEKPMAHNVHQVRTMTETAAKSKVATQLGVQRHTITGMHRTVEYIQAGVIGEVSEVHSWVSSGRGMPKVPTETPTVPPTMKWDLWIGAGKMRPYTPSIAPYKWRFFWDYGTGEAGNWGCHILDIPFWALGLTYPTRVQASGGEIHAVTTPKTMTSRMEFPAVGKRGPVVLHWYQISKPPILKELGIKGGGNTLFIGSKGYLLCGFGNPTLIPREGKTLGPLPAKTIPKSPGFHKEWINACKGDKKATCAFDYSGPLAETVILANAAFRAGPEPFDWDATTLTAKGNDNVAGYLQETPREGWEI